MEERSSLPMSFSFADRDQVNSHDFIRVILSASNAIREQRVGKSINGGKVTGALIELADVSQLAVIGDIHGDSRTLTRILAEMKYDAFLKDPTNKLIFLGDYVDRGSDSLGVLYSVAWLKTTYPESVILLRGNHECPTDFPFASHHLPANLLHHFRTSEEARQVYREILSFFDLLPIAVIIDRTALIVHGGLPVDPDLKDPKARLANAAENRLSDRWLEELLWNDPWDIQTPGKDWEKSRRGYGKHFGRRVTEKWLQLTGTRLIIRGHEPCNGYKLDHGGMVLTIFSSVDAYPAFKAAYLLATSSAIKNAANVKQLLGHIKILDS